MLLFAAEYWSITEEYTTYFEISSIYDWVFLFVGAIRIVHLLVRASSVSSKNVPRNGFLIVLLHYMYLRYCMMPAILTELCSWLKFVTCKLTRCRFTNNVLSTAQQIWLRKLGGAKPVVNEGASGIITAGRAKRSSAQSGQGGERCLWISYEI
jgi:hypothetical protein